MRFRSLALALAIILLEGCGPQMEGRTSLMGRALTITNTDTHPYTIERILVNGNSGNGDCIERPNRTLAPGESYSTTFILCGSVGKISVDTDEGTSFLQW